MMQTVTTKKSLLLAKNHESTDTNPTHHQENLSEFLFQLSDW